MKKKVIFYFIAFFFLFSIDILAIQHIKNPSEKVQLAAVMNDPFAIQHIKNPTEYVRFTAVEQNGLAIQYIKNPNEMEQLAAVMNNSLAIQHIKNPSERIQMAAIREDINAFYYIENPTENVQLHIIALGKNDKMILNLKHLSEKVQMALVKKSVKNIKFIPNLSKNVQLEIVKHNCVGAIEIRNPTASVLQKCQKFLTWYDTQKKRTIEIESEIEEIERKQRLLAQKEYKYNLERQEAEEKYRQRQIEQQQNAQNAAFYNNLNNSMSNFNNNMPTYKYNPTSYYKKPVTNIMPSTNYSGTSGRTYQYDMSNGSDRLKYSTDIDAQQRDMRSNMYDNSANIDRQRDEAVGQSGGGIYGN